MLVVFSACADVLANDDAFAMDAGVRSQALLPCGLHVVAGVGTLGSAGKFGSAVQCSASCSRNTADPSSSMPCVGKCAGRGNWRAWIEHTQHTQHAYTCTASRKWYCMLSPSFINSDFHARTICHTNDVITDQDPELRLTSRVQPASPSMGGSGQ